MDTHQSAGAPAPAGPGRAPTESEWLPYVAPFVVLVGLLALENLLKLERGWGYPLRIVAVTAALLIFSRRVVTIEPRHFLSSVLLGIAVFAIWIGPDALIPGYRGHWLFSNSITGTAASTVAAGNRENWWFLLFRVAGSSLVVPVAEELFWRAWLMRRLISADFEMVPLGTYGAAAFWLTAVVFGSEHGSYWDVGILAGILYNWWMVRTRSLADCILAHAVTNGCLAAYVLIAGKWEYWL